MLARMASAAVKKKAAQARRSNAVATDGAEEDRGAGPRGAAARVGSRSSAPGRRSGRASAGLVLIALVVYGWYLRHAGLWDDDWAVTSALIHDRSDGGGYWAGIKELWDTTAWRPVLRRLRRRWSSRRSAGTRRCSRSS